MADIMATLGLDESEYKRGLREAVREANKFSTQIDRVWGRGALDGQLASVGRRFLGVGAAIGMAAGSLREAKKHAQEFPELAPHMDAASKAAREFGSSLGRDLLAGGVEPAIEGIGWLIERVGEARTGLANFSTNAGLISAGRFSGNESAEALDRERKAAEASVRRGRLQRDLQPAELGLAVVRAESTGDTFGFNNAREQLRHTMELRKIAADQDEDRRRRLREIEAEGHSLRMAAIERERKAEEAKAVAKRREIDSEIASMQRQLGIEGLKARGHDSEARREQALGQIGRVFDPLLADPTIDAARRTQLQQQRALLEGQAISNVTAEQVYADADRRREVEERLALSRAEFEIDKLRLQSREDEARAMEIALRFERELGAVMSESALSAKRRAEIAREVEERREELITLSGQKPKDRYRSEGKFVESGLAFAPLLAGVLGGGSASSPVVQAANRSADLAAQQLAVLRDVRSALQDGRLVAVAG